VFGNGEERNGAEGGNRSPTTGVGPMSEDVLLRERRGPVLLVTLNRPSVRNAVSGELMQELAGAVEEAEGDEGIRVLVVVGAGDKAFCAGMDLRSMAGGGNLRPPEAFMRLLSGGVGIPVIAAVNGVAVGGGCEIVFGSDVVVASSNASFGLPEVKRGLFAGSGVMHVAKRLPLGVALEMVLTGDLIDVERAFQLGLVNAVVAPAEVLDHALALADRMAANSPLGLAASKELVRKVAYGSPDAEQRLETWLSVVFASDDAKEGATAFIEKRPPSWTGR
jgi:enoyl-CoA hydratase/carnithine racemase